MDTLIFFLVSIKDKNYKTIEFTKEIFYNYTLDQSGGPHWAHDVDVVGFKTSIALYFIQAFILSHKEHVISIIGKWFPLMHNIVQDYKICHMPPMIIVYTMQNSEPNIVFKEVNIRSLLWRYYRENLERFTNEDDVLN